MLISDYLSSNIMICIFLISPILESWGRNRKIFSFDFWSKWKLQNLLLRLSDLYLATFWRIFLGCVENLLKCPVWTDKNILLCNFWNMRQVCRHRLSIQPKYVLGFFNWEHFNEISHRFFFISSKKESAKMSNFDRKNNPLCISWKMRQKCVDTD